MLFFSIFLISFFIKFFLFYKSLFLKISEKKIKTLLFFLLTYDIITDFVYFMYDAKAELRPWWFNILSGTSLFYFLAKIHGFRYFCKIFIKKKYNSTYTDYFFLFLSFFLALPRFIFYSYFCIKKNFITEIIPSFLRYKTEIYIAHFTVTIYPFILLFNPIKNLYEKLKISDTPIIINKLAKFFLYFGIIPRIILDFIQTSTWKYIQNFLFENNQLNYKLHNQIVTKNISILVTFYFFITYFFAKKIEKILNFNEKESENFEQLEDFKKEEFIIDIKSFYENNDEFNTKDIINSFIKKNISKILNVPIEYINIYLLNNEENFYLSELNNSNKYFENYIKKNSFVLFDEIEAFLYLSNDKIANEKLIPIKDYFKKKNIDAFFSFKNEEKIDGIIIIERQNIFLEEKNYSEENIEKIIYFLEQIKILKKNFNLKKNLDILNFKSKKLEDFAEYITNVHENIILNLNNTFLNVKSYFLIFQKKKIKWLSSERFILSDKLEEVIRKKYYSEYLIEDTKPLIHREKNYTFIINKIKEKKNDIFSIFVFPFSFIDFNEHKFMLTFTEIGKKISELIPGNNNLFFEYKNKLISIFNENRPNILIYKNEKFDYITNIFKKLNENIEVLNFSYEELNNEIYIKKIFNYEINKFLETSLTKIFLIINNFEKINSNFQKLILEEYIKEEDKIFKEKKIKLKIIFTISSIQDLTYLNHNIIGISIIHDLSSIKIKDILENEKEKFIEKICKNILNINITSEQATGVFNIIKEQTEDFSFYNFIKFLENYFSDYKKESNISIESYIQKAIILGKNSLKDPELMFSLAKIYNNNYSKIAKTLGIHKSSVSRFFKKYKQSMT